MRAASTLAVLAALLSAPGCGAPPTAPAVVPADSALEAVPGLLDALARHRIVLYGEEHGSRESHAVLQALVRDPRFRELVDDLVVEFGNALHQDTVDRYVAGEDVPFAEVRRAFEDTAIPLTWNAPMYAELFELVRAVNHTSEGRALRIVLGEAALDWSAVHEPADYEPFADRSGELARTIEREVLDRGRRGLLVVGGVHVLRREARNDFRDELPPHPGVGQLLASTRPGASFAIWPIHGLAGRAEAWRAPALLELRGTALGSSSFGAVAPRNVQIRREVEGELRWVPLAPDQWPPMEVMVDALLDLGPTSTIEPPDPERLRDEAYVDELRRRCRIVDGFYGFDFYSTDLAERVADARR